ncbi:hypothetical protein [Dongia rigui]|uniref:Uncharacterized protein n=1 Tax=Dongia rigui TaxID=940149 RepID=A0ABU5DYZ5_9PROT|nr:hypothetical protein [Dongia rigui]MDY0872458.1 hypothetical protein [Dongia rigui]
MTATDATPSKQPRHLWLHVLRAALASPILPDAGHRYLGMPLKAHALNNESSPFGIIPMVVGWIFVLLVFVLADSDINSLILCAVVWLAIGLWSGIKMLRWVRAHPRDVCTVPFNISSTTIGNLIWIPIFGWLILGQGSAPTYFFRVETGTPLAKAGDILYAIDFSRSRVDIGRGQLLLANVDSQPTLVRVIGIPGDLVGIGSYAIHVNAHIIRIGAS